MWGKVKPPKNQSKTEVDQILVNKLENLEYHADPQFQRALRQRLLANLEQSPARPLSRRRFSPAWGAGLALGGLGLAALVVVFVSVLSVRSVETNQPTTLAVVASVPPPATPDGLPTVLPATVPAPVSAQATANSVQPVGLTLYNPADQTNLSASQAVSLTGFAVRPPTYLPLGYTLEAATVQTATTRPEPANVAFSGYYLRYSAAKGGSKSVSTTLEVSQWKVPFSFRPNSEGRATSLADPDQRRNPVPKVILQNAQRSQNLTIQGQPATLLQGPNWRISIISTGPGPAERPFTPPAGRPGLPGFNSPSAMANGGPIMFGRLIPGQPDYYIEFGRRGEGKNSRALVWQKDEVLHVVNTADNLTADELQRVAESLHE